MSEITYKQHLITVPEHHQPGDPNILVEEILGKQTVGHIAVTYVFTTNSVISAKGIIDKLVV